MLWVPYVLPIECSFDLIDLMRSNPPGWGQTGAIAPHICLKFTHSPKQRHGIGGDPTARSARAILQASCELCRSCGRGIDLVWKATQTLGVE